MSKARNASARGKNFKKYPPFKPGIGGGVPFAVAAVAARERGGRQTQMRNRTTGPARVTLTKVSCLEASNSNEVKT